MIFFFSPDETEYWCGSCTVPLAMVLQEDAGKGTAYVVTEPVKRTVIVPVEPQVSVTVYRFCYYALIYED